MAAIKTLPDGSKRIRMYGFWVREAQGSGEYDLSDTSISATRRFIVDANDALPFARALKGNIAIYGDYFRVTQPAGHPQFPGIIYCTRVQVKPDPSSKSTPSGPEGIISYARSFVDVDYGIPTVNPDEVDVDLKAYYTEDLDFAVEVLTIPGGGGLKFDENREGGPIRPEHPPVGLTMPQKLAAYKMKYLDRTDRPRAQQEGDDEDEDEEEANNVKQDTNVLIGTQDIVYDFPNVNRVNYNVIRRLRGKVNDKVFGGVPRGSLLFVGARTRREVNAKGFTISKSLTVVMKEHQYGWNREWKKDVGWVVVNPPLYDYEDFLLLTRQIFL